MYDFALGCNLASLVTQRVAFFQSVVLLTTDLPPHRTVHFFVDVWLELWTSLSNRENEISIKIIHYASARAINIVHRVLV